MSVVDHPHGGGERRAPIGRKKNPQSLWGYIVINKYSDNLIFYRRSK